MISTRNGLLAGLAALTAFGFSACAGGMQMHKPEQGLQGAFSTYGPPPVIRDCNPLVTQFEKDSCKHDNARVIEEPYQGSFKVRNLTSGESAMVTLDAEGKYRVQLVPGEYEVCVAGECSDPINVRMGAFSVYGQRLPRAVPDTGVAVKPAKASGSKKAAQQP